MIPENENTIIVYPINIKGLTDFITATILPIEDIEYKISYFGISLDASLELDKECVYSLLVPRYIGGQIQKSVDIPIIICKTVERGHSTSMFPSFYFTMGMTELSSFFDKPVTLKQFMDTRYDYNPRIKTNMRQLIKYIVEQMA